MEINTLRKEYTHEQLRRNDLAISPFDQFTKWLALAIDQKIVEANAMTLATASKDGRSSCRTVLLKEIDTNGFIFYTN